jgi:hypothetical protein
MSRLRRPAVRLSIAPVAKVYVTGDPITLRVTLVGRHDVGVRGAQAGLTARIWYRRPEATRTHAFVAPPSSPPTPPPATVTGPVTSLGLPATLPAGSTIEREAIVQNWARAPSGVLGIPRVEYRLWTRLFLLDGSTVTSGAPVQLESPRSLNQHVEGAPPSYRELKVEFRRGRLVRYRGPCDLLLRLPALYARPGETLRGVLEVSPHHPTTARRILVSLQQIEALAGSAMPSAVSYAECRGDVVSPVTNARRVKAVPLAGRTSLTEARHFPFTIQLPGHARQLVNDRRAPLCPTILTRYLAVRWYLRGWVQDDSFQWQVCDTEINVYTAR